MQSMQSDTTAGLWLSRSTLCAVSICSLIASTGAHSQQTISTASDLGSALENAVTCKSEALGAFDGSEFDGSPSDTRKQLETLGVQIKNENKHGGETALTFPHNIRIFGYSVQQATFFSESTLLFFVKIDAGWNQLRTLNTRLMLKPIAKDNPEGYGYFNEFNVDSVRKLKNDTDLSPYTIFSGTTRENGHEYIVLGCQSLSW
jgi:hypothetical protein